MGQLASNLGNSNVTDPSQARPGDLDNSEKAARLIAGGTKGLTQGFAGMQQQNQQMRQPGPQAQVPMAQQPNVNLPMGLPQQQQKPNNLAFYGQ